MRREEAQRARAKAERRKAERSAAERAAEQAARVRDRFTTAAAEARTHEGPKAAVGIAASQPSGLPWDKVVDQLLTGHATDPQYRERTELAPHVSLDVGDLRSELELAIVDRARICRSRMPPAPPSAISAAAAAIRKTAARIVKRILDELRPDQARPATTPVTAPAPPAAPAPVEPGGAEAPAYTGRPDANPVRSPDEEPGGAVRPRDGAVPRPDLDHE